MVKVFSEFFEGWAYSKRDELKALAFVLFGMCNWAYPWYDPRGPIKPKKLSKIIRTVFLKCIVEQRKRHGQKRSLGSITKLTKVWRHPGDAPPQSKPDSGLLSR